MLKSVLNINSIGINLCFRASVAAELTVPKFLEPVAFPGSSLTASLSRSLCTNNEACLGAGGNITFWANALETLNLQNQTWNVHFSSVIQTSSLSS